LDKDADTNTDDYSYANNKKSFDLNNDSPLNELQDSAYAENFTYADILEQFDPLEEPIVFHSQMQAGTRDYVLKQNQDSYAIF